jgi:hypothetical protein
MPRTPRSLLVLALVYDHMTPRLEFPPGESSDWVVVNDLVSSGMMVALWGLVV